MGCGGNREREILPGGILQDLSCWHPHHDGFPHLPQTEAHLTKRIKTLSEQAFLEFLGPGEPLEVLQARHAEDAALAMAEKDQPLEDLVRIRIRIVPGRPPKGQEAPVRLKAIKMPEAFWTQMEAAARHSGLNLHAAMREALTTWTQAHRPKAG